MIVTKPSFENLSISQTMHCVRSLNGLENHIDIKESDEEPNIRQEMRDSEHLYVNPCERDDSLPKFQPQIFQNNNHPNLKKPNFDVIQKVLGAINESPPKNSFFDSKEGTSQYCIPNVSNENEQSCNLKERLLSALKNLIPHKSSLTLRLLVSYAVDDGVSDVIVIDETLRRNSTPNENYADEESTRERSPIRNQQRQPSTFVLDLSCRGTDEDIHKRPSQTTSNTPTTQMASIDSLTQAEILNFAKNLLNVNLNKPTRFAIDQSVLNIFPALQDITTKQNNYPVNGMAFPQISQPLTTSTSFSQDTLLMLQSLITSNTGFGTTPLTPFSLGGNPLINVSQPTLVNLPTFNNTQEFTINMPIATQSLLTQSDVETMLNNNFHSAKLLNDVVQNITTTSSSDFLNTFYGQPRTTNELNIMAHTDSISTLTNHDTNDSMNAKANMANNVRSFSRRFMHPRRFMCNQCRQHFPSLAELNRHTLDLHNSFRCNFCKAKFTQRSNLQRHSLKHVGFKPFTCNICKKEYYRKDHLVRHIEVTHPSEDPKANITVRLTSSECLDFLDNLEAYPDNQLHPTTNGLLVNSSTLDGVVEGITAVDSCESSKIPSNEEASPKSCEQTEQDFFSPKMLSPAKYSPSNEEITCNSNLNSFLPQNILQYESSEKLISTILTSSPIRQNCEKQTYENLPNGSLATSSPIDSAKMSSLTLEQIDELELPEMRPLRVDEDMDMAPSPIPNYVD